MVTRQIDFSRVTGLSCKGSWNFDRCLALVSARVYSAIFILGIASLPHVRVGWLSKAANNFFA